MKNTPLEQIPLGHRRTTMITPQEFLTWLKGKRSKEIVGRLGVYGDGPLERAVVSICHCDYACISYLTNGDIVFDITICWDENGNAYTGPSLLFTDIWIQQFDTALLQLAYANNKQYRIKRIPSEQCIQALEGVLMNWSDVSGIAEKVPQPEKVMSAEEFQQGWVNGPKRIVEQSRYPTNRK